jgi:hypothetical protein
MYCPQCGTESQTTLQYCRLCGANLKVIGKAVALSEAIARSDRGPLPKIREMVKNLKVDQVTDEVSRALDGMNNEIAQISPQTKPVKETRPWINLRNKKTPEERRENHITKGIVSMFSGAGLTIFLYYLSAAMVLKLPPHIIADIPFEIEPVLRVIWLFGLIPTLTGLGHILAGLLIQTNRHQAVIANKSQPEQIEFPKQAVAPTSSIGSQPRSVTENTTGLLGERSIR